MNKEKKRDNRGICIENMQNNDARIYQHIDAETNTKFKLNASVVRIVEEEDGKMLFGCRLMQESAAIAKFVNTKQRERNRLDRQ